MPSPALHRHRLPVRHAARQAGGDAAAAASRRVEIFENDLLTFDGSPARVPAGWSPTSGSTVSLFQPFRDFEAMPEPQRARNLDRAERKFDTMQALGAELLLVCSNVQPATLDDPDRAAADLRAMAERAARRGLRVGYEALAWGRQSPVLAAGLGHRAPGRPRRALGLIAGQLPHPCLGDDPPGSPRCRPKNCSSCNWPTRRACPWTRCPGAGISATFPGQGELPVAGFLREMLAAGYRGPLSLEIFNDEFRAAPRPASPATACAACLAGTRPGRARFAPCRRRRLPPPCHGIEFIEFAVDEAPRAELGGFLHPRLPPRRAASLKAVELCRNGRHQPRAERRARQRRRRTFRGARSLGVRHGVAGG